MWVWSLGWEALLEAGWPALQYSCLENPSDGGAWWAEGSTWLKQPSPNSECINPVTVSVLLLFLVTFWVSVYCSNNRNLLFCISSFPGCTEGECLQDTEKGCQICPFLCAFVHVHVWLLNGKSGKRYWWMMRRLKKASLFFPNHLGNCTNMAVSMIPSVMAQLNEKAQLYPCLIHLV